jgi:putative membrane protein
MLWFKALHLIFMVTWFAGLFYLPRLFVYHAMADDQVSVDRFKVMERKLFIMMTMGAVLTFVFGIGLLMSGAYLGNTLPLWLKIKFILLGVLVLYHWHCHKMIRIFRCDNNKYNHIFFRWYNEFPILILFAIIFLAILRPT